MRNTRDSLTILRISRHSLARLLVRCRNAPKVPVDLSGLLWYDRRMKKDTLDEFVIKEIDRFIAKYAPALFAFEHGDLGHSITWPNPYKAVCSCGEERESKKSV